MDSGHDVYFTQDAGCFAIHTQTREEIEVPRRGGKFEIDAEVVLPFHRLVKPINANSCSFWVMN